MVETLRLSPQGDTACRILRLLAQNDGKPVSPRFNGFMNGFMVYVFVPVA